MAIRNPLPDLPNLFILGKPKKKGLTFFFDGSKKDLSAEEKAQLLNNLSARLQEIRENDLEFENKSDVEKYLKEIFGSSVDLNNPSTINVELSKQINLQQQTGELQADQYQIPDDIKAQIQEVGATQLDLQRDVNKTLPLLREALAGATGRGEKLTTLILSNYHYNNILKNLLTTELQSGLPIDKAVINVLGKARTNPALASVVALADAQTRNTLLATESTKPEDLVNLDQKTAELVVQKIRENLPSDLNPEQTTTKAKKALETRFQVGSETNLEKTLIASGKTKEQATGIIANIKTQATLGATPEEITTYLVVNHNLPKTGVLPQLTTLYTQNIQDSLYIITQQHPQVIKQVLEDTGRKQLFDRVIKTGQETTTYSAPLNYIYAVKTQPKTTSSSRLTPPSYHFATSFVDLDLSNTNVRSLFIENPTSSPQPNIPGGNYGNFNFTSKPPSTGGGLGGFLIQMGGNMLKDAAGNKLKEMAAGWLVKAGLVATGVGAPVVAAYEALKQVPIVGGIVKKLEKEVLKKSWEALKKMAVVGGAVVGAGIAGLVALVAKFGTAAIGVGGGALVGFFTGGPIGAFVGGSTAAAVQFFWPQISGFASGLWNGAGSLVGGLGSGVGSFGSSLFSGIASLGSTIGQGIGWTIGWTLGGVGGVAVFAAVTATSTFLTEPPENEYLVFETPNSDYIEVTKTASKTNIATAELDTTVTYTIRIVAKTNTLTNIRVTNNTTITQESGVQIITTDELGNAINNFPNIPTELTPENSPYEFTYTIPIDSTRNDARILDIVTVTADVPDLNITNQISRAQAAVLVGNAPTGPTFDCDNAGQEITVEAGRYPVTTHLLPGGRSGYCIVPTMIVIHWSGGWSGNEGTRNTLINRGLSCQIGTQQDGSVEQWVQHWESKVELAWCVGGGFNDYAISNEMVGNGFQPDTFNDPGLAAEFDSSIESTCWYMRQYNIPASQIFGHYELTPGKSDPGANFLHETFIPEVIKRCG